MTCENKGTYFTHCLWAFSPARVYTNKNVFFPAVFNTFSSYASRLVWLVFFYLASAKLKLQSCGRYWLQLLKKGLGGQNQTGCFLFVEYIRRFENQRACVCIICALLL